MSLAVFALYVTVRTHSWWMLVRSPVTDSLSLSLTLVTSTSAHESETVAVLFVVVVTAKIVRINTV